MKRLLSLVLCVACIWMLAVPIFSADAKEYIKIEKEEYYDKTLAGFLSQIVGMLSGYEYKSEGGRYVVGMPDDWFAFCNGPYAGNFTYLTHVDKHIKNAESGIFEVWIDDDFGVDIFNQYILEDMYEDYGTVNSRAVSDGWLKYGIWDMGGGQRQVGAYGNISREYYLPQFAGNGEYGNMYSYLSEPYLATDTLGMNAGGMPESAASLAGVFATVTGDRDNVEWAKLFSAMLSMAYFESDIQTLIKNAAKIFPSGSYSASLVDEVFALYEKYPANWRDAFVAYEKAHYVEGITSGANTTVNCGFVLLILLYGDGDYMETAKIGSLAGYDCESTAGIALSVLGIINGTAILPEDVNALVWQNGKGVVVNQSPNGIPEGERMHADNLDERMPIESIVKKYVKNFEFVLAENGGYSDNTYYYIPKQGMSEYCTVEIENGGFEKGNLDGFEVNGKAAVTKVSTFGKFGAKLYEDSELYTKVKGLTKGKKYTLTAFVSVTEFADAFLFVRDKNGGVCASVCTEGVAKSLAHTFVKRTLVFTATDNEMEIGVRAATESVPLQYVAVDGFTLLETFENAVGNVIIENKNEAQSYKMLYAFINAEKRGEHLLKLSFFNHNDGIVDAKIIVNAEGYAAAALYKTSDTSGIASADAIYIPIVLEEGVNRVSLSFDGYVVGITDAELVNVNYR